MKKLTLILAGVLVFSLCAASLFAAESEDVKKRYLGLVLGLNFGQFIGDNANASEFYGGGEKGSRMGVDVGVFAHLGIGNIFAIEPQVLYSQNGSKYRDFAPAWNDEFTLKMDYLMVPLLLRFYIPPIPVVKVNVFGGGYFGYNFVAKYKYTETGYEDEGDMDDIFVQWEEIDYGLIFGAGIAYPRNKMIPRLDLRYSFGLANIWDLPPDDDIRNGVFSILASVGF